MLDRSPRMLATAAREQMVVRLTVNAGINPFTGFPAALDAKLQRQVESLEGRQERLDYLNGFRAQAASELSGLIHAGLIETWYRGDRGSVEQADNDWAGELVFSGSSEIDLLRLDHAHFSNQLRFKYPLNELGEVTTAAILNSSDTHYLDDVFGDTLSLHAAVAFISTGDEALSSYFSSRVRRLFDEGQDGHLVAWTELASCIQAYGVEDDRRDSDKSVEVFREKLRLACELGFVSASGIQRDKCSRSVIPKEDFHNAQLWHGDGATLIRSVNYDASLILWRAIRFTSEHVKALRTTNLKTIISDPGAPPQKRKRGRPSGSGSYDAADEPILAQMHDLICRGEAKSGYYAAGMLAHLAQGSGTRESKRDRLSRNYQIRFGQPDPSENH